MKNNSASCKRLISSVLFPVFNCSHVSFFIGQFSIHNVLFKISAYRNGYFLGTDLVVYSYEAEFIPNHLKK